LESHKGSSKSWWSGICYELEAVSLNSVNGSMHSVDFMIVLTVGALAGIADQPLQVFTRVQTADCGTVSGTATGLVSGISKGLIGAVTKPIGGAAEFVSQTSLGLLHHVGVMGDCRHKHLSVELPLSKFLNSLAKYQE